MTRDMPPVSLGSGLDEGHGQDRLRDIPAALSSGDRDAKTPRRARTSSSPPPSEGRSRRAPARLLPPPGTDPRPRTTPTEAMPPTRGRARWPNVLAITVACILALLAVLLLLRAAGLLGGRA